MVAQGFVSLLGNEIARFVQHKRVLGRCYETEVYALRIFDRYLVARSVRAVDAITPELIDAFLLSRPRRRPRSSNHLRGVIHRLFDWGSLPVRSSRVHQFVALHDGHGLRESRSSSHPSKPAGCSTRPRASL